VVTNRISGNAFEQTLQMIRRPNQEREGTPGNVRPLEQVPSQEGAAAGQSSTDAGGNSNPNTTGTGNSANSETAADLIPASGTRSPINEEADSVGERPDPGVITVETTPGENTTTTTTEGNTTTTTTTTGGGTTTITRVPEEDE